MRPFRPLRALLAVLALAAAAGCERPCAVLADRLCEQAGDDDQACEAWRERISRVPSQTCENGLKALDRERVQ